MRLALITLLLLPTLGHSQIFEQDVIGSSGDYYQATTHTIGWTVGEVAIEYYLGTSNHITEGFWNELFIPSGIGNEESEFLISTYPNPAINELNLNLPENLSSVEIQIQNSLGQIVQTHLTDAANYSIDISDLAPGTYILVIINDSERIESQKILKL